MKKIKLMQILSDSNIGGAGIVVKTITENLGDEFEIYLVLPRNAELINRLKIRKNLTIIEIEGIKDVSFSISGFKNLKRVIKDIKPDIIHSHSTLSARIAARFYRKAYIVNTRHCIESISSNPIKFFIKKTVNNYLSDSIIAVSDSVYDNLIKTGVSKQKLVKIDNSVDEIKILMATKINELKQNLKIENKLVIGFIGRLALVKNPLAMIKIANYLREHNDNFVFLVAGIGDLETNLKSKINECKLSEHFILMGQINDLSKFYSLIDVCINTSISEAISLSLLEAMSSSKPIIAYDIDSLSQVIKHNENGFLIKKFDNIEYARAILSLFDKEYRLQLGEKSKLIFEDKFSLSKMIIKIEKFYKTCYSGLKGEK